MRYLLILSVYLAHLKTSSAFDTGLFQHSKAYHSLPLSPDSIPSLNYGSTVGINMGGGMMYFLPGLSLNLDYCWFENNFFGMGAKYSFFQHRGSARAGVREVFTVHAFTPSLNFRYGLKKSYLYSNFLFGLVVLEAYPLQRGYTGSMEGRTGGLGIDLGYEWILSGKKSFGIRLSALRAIVKNITVSGYASTIFLKEPTDISRVEITLGYRFN